MADPAVEIEAELRRAVVTVNDANDQRRRLKKSFLRLAPDQAGGTAKEATDVGWFAATGGLSQARPRHSPSNCCLCWSKGSEPRQPFSFSLTSQAPRNKRQTRNWQKGFRWFSPDYARTERDKFLGALKGNRTPTATPSVLLEFRGTGKFSAGQPNPGVAVSRPGRTRQSRCADATGAEPRNGKQQNGDPRNNPRAPARRIV